MKDLILIRGVSGSGKSTFAHVIAKSICNVISADDYFINAKTGKYEFDKSKLNKAHTYCQKKTEKNMVRGDDMIIVANTFTREWEMKPYYDLAKKYNYRVFSIIVENRHGETNKHGVSDDYIQIMRNRFEVKL